MIQAELYKTGSYRRLEKDFYNTVPGNDQRYPGEQIGIAGRARRRDLSSNIVNTVLFAIIIMGSAGAWEKEGHHQTNWCIRFDNCIEYRTAVHSIQWDTQKDRQNQEGLGHSQ